MKAIYRNLPETLAAKLGRVEKRVLLLQTSQMFVSAFCVLAGIWLLVYLSDRVWDTPRVLRLLFLGVAVTGTLAFLWLWLRARLRAHRDPTLVVRRVQRQFRNLGIRFRGVVELSQEDELPDNISPELCRAAIRQVAAQTAPLNFGKAISMVRIRRLLTGLGIGAVILVLLAVVDGRAVINALQRWGRPLAAVPRYTFVGLSALPESLRIPYGEPFEMKVTVDRQSRWVPGSARFRLQEGTTHDVPFVGGEAQVELPGQTADTGLTVRAGDAREHTRIIPTHRPVLLELTAEVTPPEYLCREPENRDIELRTVPILEGSTIQFRGVISRGLTAAEMVTDRRTELGVDGDAFLTEVLPWDAVTDVEFWWQDNLGFRTRDGYEIKLKPVADEAPYVECPGRARSVAILEDEPLKIPLRAEDDYGVKELAVEWEVYPMGSDRPLSPTRMRRPLVQGSPTETVLTDEFLFSPLLLDIPPQTVVRFYATATDYFPGRGVVLSAEYQIFILSHAEHARLIEEELRELQARLEDLALREEELMHDNERVATLPEDELKASDVERELNRNEQGEQSNARDLQALSEEMAKLIKEALRNENFTEEMLEQWGEMAEMMSQMANQDMQEVSQNLQKASANEEQRRKEVADAAEKQREILEKLRDMSEKLGDEIEKMSIRNFASRLREASDAQRQVGVALARLLPQIVGMKMADIEVEVRRLVLVGADTQAQIRGEIEQIKHDIYSYFGRTKITKYEDVFKDMEAKEVMDKLEELHGMIAENQGVNSITEAGYWSKTFSEWADMLDKKPDSSDESEGEPQEMTPEQLEMLFAIMRVIQKEQDIRDQTQFLERHRDTMANYPDLTGELKGVQGDNRGKLAEITAKVGHPQVKALLAKGGEIMGEVEDFLNLPQTDRETVSAESAAIELLSMLFQSNGGGGGGAGSGFPALMAMMMQMGMGAGATPGGSMAGGDTDRPNVPVAGTTGGNVEARAGESRLTGGELDALPAEFRPMIEAYYRKMEESRVE